MLCQSTNIPVGRSTCLANLARPSSIRFFNDYNFRSFCKHPRSMQHFFSGSRILFCCFKGSRAFLSSLFFSACIFFRLFLVAQSNFDDLKGLESLIERDIDASVKHTLGCLWYVLQKIRRHELCGIELQHSSL